MKKSIKVSIVGAVLLVGGLVVYLGGTTIGIMRSFNSVAESGTSSPEQLAEGISNSLISTAVGIPVSILGFCLLVGGAIAYLSGRQQDKSETF